MRRLLEIGEIIRNTDHVIRYNECQIVPHHWTEIPVAEGDFPIYRNEPDGRAEMLAALQAIEAFNTPLPLGLLEQARKAIAKAKEAA